MLPILKTIEPFALLLALLPLVGYLLVLGLVRFSGRALVTTGARDIAALGIAIAGMIAVGPAQLFFPATAATVFGSIIWFALAAFYFLILMLVCLTTTPKLVVYGRKANECYDALLQAARRMDESATGDEATMQVTLPALDTRLRVDSIPGLDHCRVVSFVPILSIKFWHQLLRHLRGELKDSPSPALRRGLGMLVFALGLGAFLTWHTFNHQGLVVQGFRDWLWQ